MVRIATACLLFVAMNVVYATANAQENLTNLNPLRLEFSFSQTSADAKQGSNEIGTLSSDRFGTITYYFKRQFFAEVGYGRPRTHKITLNGQSLTTRANQDTALSLYGLGFRSYRKGSDGEYLGIAVRYTSDMSDESNNNSTQIIRLFTQKDTHTRYGVLQLSSENGDAGEINRLGGQHVWFNDNGIGFGFQWAFGMGREVNENGVETNYRSRDAGIIVMYRPSLTDSGYIPEPLDESTDKLVPDTTDEDYVDTTLDATLDEPFCVPSEDTPCKSDENPFTDSDENPFGDPTEPTVTESDEQPLGDPTQPSQTENNENPFGDSTELPPSNADVNPFTDSIETPTPESEKNPLDDSTEIQPSNPDKNPFSNTSETSAADSDKNPFCDEDADPFCESTEARTTE